VDENRAGDGEHAGNGAVIFPLLVLFVLNRRRRKKKKKKKTVLNLQVRTSQANHLL